MVVGNTIVWPIFFWFQAVTNHINLQNNLDSILFWKNLFFLRTITPMKQKLQLFPIDDGTWKRARFKKKIIFLISEI